MAEKKAFQAESRRLLDLMINSIYTHKEIFLRELISNASDAIDKYYYEALQAHKDPGKLSIRIELNEENRTLRISDNGIGMTEQEMEENLGTIAKSGSLAFKEEMAKKEEEKSDVDIIGQFGVGFYSAFMVAKEVTVISKSEASDQAWKWVSDGASGYTIEPVDRKERGTEIILDLKEDDDLENYSMYLQSWKVEELVKKYSDYIRYPIEMSVETSQVVKGTEDQESPEYETVLEDKTLNSMIPLWKRQKSQISEEEFSQFYKEHFYDYAEPLKTIFFKVEGNVEFTALLYIPSRIPNGFYSQEYKPGLQLYSRGVFIMDHCEELLPGWLRFVRGLVDSQDLSLNISREMLQHDHQLRIIRQRIEKKILNELGSMLAKERETYEKFWANFGLDLKFGVYSSFGQDKDKLENLLLFHTNKNKLQTLAEIKGEMPEDQKEIYYISGSNPAQIAKTPIARKLESKGFVVLYLNAEVDEFVMQTLDKYQDIPFRNASQGELDLSTEEEKEALDKSAAENKGLLEFLNETLKPEVKEVRLSNRLDEDPVTLVAGEGLSFEMERVYAAMASQEDSGMPPMKADRILELNPHSKVFALLSSIYESDPEKAKTIAQVLYDQALLIEGFKIDDPIEYSRKVASLIA
jgi:molecular chaperone HtpG